MDEIEVRRFLELMHPNDDALLEVRIMEQNKSFSGYFKNKELLIEKLKKFNSQSNVYFVLNSINDACYSRSQMDKIVFSKTTTTDANIINREWLFIDIDAKRPSDVSSNEAELKNAIELARKIFKYLRNFGFYEPIVCMSGNGAYLLYKIDLENTQENTELIKKCLQSLDMLFSNETADVDTTVFNPARIAKIIGTTARKGSNTEDRPHRLSKILSVPQQIRVIERPFLEKLAALIPEKEKPTYENNYGRSEFNLDSFISEFGISIHKQQSFSGGTKYQLATCPFCGHSAPDSAIFKMNDGSLGFKCFHNSCSDKTWKDFREYYQPSSTRKSNYYNGDMRFMNNRNQYNNNQQQKSQIDNKHKETESEEKGNVWLQMNEVKYEDRSDIITMPTKILQLDDKILGANKGETTVVSGLNSSGKTSLLSQICLSFVNQGYNGAIWSGEMKNSRLQNWLHLQAAGRTWNQKAPDRNYYYTPSHARQQIDKWLYDKLFLYNDKYTNNFKWIVEQIHILTEEKDISWILLDNLMALDLLNVADSDNNRQTEAILEIVDIGKRKNCHMILVAHPRKSTTFLRKEDIGGSGNLTNAVDNVWIFHRVNRDFEKRASEFYEKPTVIDIIDRGYGNVIESCKNRDLGRQDFFAGVYYEEESKRFLNDRHENITYNWVDYELDKQLAEQKEQKNNDIILPNNSFEIEPPKVNKFPFIDENKIQETIIYPKTDRNALTNDLPF